jgi:hypothetical protein
LTNVAQDVEHPERDRSVVAVISPGEGAAIPWKNVEDSIVAVLMGRFSDSRLSEIEISEREARSIADDIFQRVR